MTFVETKEGYDFYIRAGHGNTPTLYNIVKAKSEVPVGGYPNRRYIERIKGVKFPDRYQPTLHGMQETYASDLWSGV